MSDARWATFPARVRKDKGVPRPQANGSWAELIGGVQNPDVRGLFERDLPGGEKRLAARDVAIRIAGVKRYHVGVRRNHAYVWQSGRFADDEQYWKELLSTPNEVMPVNGGTALRFDLRTSADVQAFEAAIPGRLHEVSFIDADSDLPDSNDIETTTSQQR